MAGHPKRSLISSSSISYRMLWATSIRVLLPGSTLQVLPSARWLMELIDFPVEGSAGILVGGGSVASLYCLAVARHWAAAKFGWNMREQGLQGNHPPLVFYISEEGHSCLRKASHLLGLG